MGPSRIAVSTSRKDLNSCVDERFGRCPYFMLCDFTDIEGTAHWRENPALTSTGGARIAAAQFMDQEKVELLITGSLGPNALRVIQASGVSAYSASESMTVFGKHSGLAKRRVTDIKPDTLSTVDITNQPRFRIDPKLCEGCAACF